MEFQTNLKKLRTEERLTQDQLAFFIELSEEVFFDSNAEGIINIIYPKNLAEGKELDYIW